MNNTKIKAVMDEVATEAAERDELIQCIAVALLAKKNLFILGDTGQAKSYCINAFRKRITGAKQFERLMSKQSGRGAVVQAGLICQVLFPAICLTASLKKTHHTA